MKRNVRSDKADKDNPAWSAETFARAQPAAEVLPELFVKKRATEMLKPRGRPKSD